MCAIFAILFPKGVDSTKLRSLALRQSRLLRHRGPDWSGIRVEEGGAILAHERLALVGLGNGAQPIVSKDGNLILCVNGEIYNHRKYRAALSDVYDFQTESDCEIIMALYAKYRDSKEGPTSFIDLLEGMFAFVLWDVERGVAVVGRDHVGIIPLYTAIDKTTGCRYFASEMKAFVGIDQLDTVAEFPRRHVQTFTRSEAITEPVLYYTRPWEATTPAATAVAAATVPSPSLSSPATTLPATAREQAKKTVHDSLCAAVHSHMMCDTPYGVLLSGGLDSSIISAIAKKYAEMRTEADDSERAWWPQLHSFAIGLEGAPDLAAAAVVAKQLGTVHHEMHFTVQEGLDAIRDVVGHIETYDVTTIRASTPMYLLARKIKATGVKMVLSGEGADELFGGYLYFHKAPNAKELHAETVRKLEKLHQYDCLRANKAMAAWGVEARVPFLDKDFIDVAMSIDPEFKMIHAGKTIEKQILREAFEEYLPAEICWRQKEQFGDGVGYSWIDSVKDHAAAAVSDAAFAQAEERFPFNTPATKESFLYRSFFAELFPDDALYPQMVPVQGKSVACSTAEALEWDASLKAVAADPSGRAILGVHQSAQK